MAKTQIILSLGYWFSSFSLGLLVHPYKTMRQLMREDVMSKLRFLPLVLWLMSWLVGLVLLRIGGVVSVFLGDGLVEVVKLALGFLFVWWSVFVCLWQVVLVYLWRRFSLLN